MVELWQHMLLCGVGAKPVAHLMQYHCTLLQWEVAKVKQLMNSNMTLTVLNLYQDTQRCNNHDSSKRYQTDK